MSKNTRDLRRQDLRDDEEAPIIALKRARGNWSGTSRLPTRSFKQVPPPSDRRARQGDCRRHRMQPLQGRCVLHQRPRRGHGRELSRTSTIARPGEPGGDLVGDRRSPSAPAATPDHPQLRSTTNLVSWGTAQAKPWARHHATYRSRGALHELHARARSRYWKAELVLPAPTRGVARHRRSVRECPRRRRRTQVALKMGKLGILTTRSQTGAFIRAAIRLSDSRRRRSDPRQSDVSAWHRPRGRQGSELVPEHSEVQELASNSVQPATNAMYLPLSLSSGRRRFVRLRACRRRRRGPVRRRDYKHPISTEISVSPRP